MGIDQTEEGADHTVYSIVRFYAPHHNRPPEVIYTGYSLEEAQEHCNDPNTREDGEWFDGYRAE